MKIFACVVLFLTCTACVSVSNRFSPELINKSDIGPNSGVILFSAGADKKCVATSSFLGVLGAADNAVQVPGYSLGIDAFTIKSDFKDHYGFVHALNLPAGKYFVDVTRANVLVEQDFKKTASFTVAPGKYTYIGEFYLTTSCAPNIASVVRDNYERDVAFAKQKNPLFQDAVIDKQLTKWQ